MQQRKFYLAYDLKDSYGKVAADGETEGLMPADAKLTFDQIQAWVAAISESHRGSRVRITLIQELEA